MKKIYSSLLVLVFAFGVFQQANAQQVIPTGNEQADFINAYKLVFEKAYDNYRTNGSNVDSLLFPTFGEGSVYMIKTGADKGKFVLPTAIPGNYTTVTGEPYEEYLWQNQEHYSLKIESFWKRVAIFSSSLQHNGSTVSWETSYFTALFDSYFRENWYELMDEDRLENGISNRVDMLIIPAFSAYGEDYKYFIDQIFDEHPAITEKLNNYLATGGTIYAEGNAVYFVEKLGYLQNNAVDFSDAVGNFEGGNYTLNTNQATHAINFAAENNDMQIYAHSIPFVSSAGLETILSLQTDGRPVVFELNNENANGGRIICNLGLPTVEGFNVAGNMQSQYFLNTLLYSFAEDADVTRRVWNELPNGVTANSNAISYNRTDTFDVVITCRNLCTSEITDLKITEDIKEYFTLYQILNDDEEVVFDTANNVLVFQNVNIPALSQREIRYQLITPSPEDSIHAEVNNFITWQTLIYPSYNTTEYTAESGKRTYYNYRNYADLMFSAEIVADADFTENNRFLRYGYAPYSVSTQIENKERTASNSTVYTQIIPMDVPLYSVDRSLNIPILKTPGGQYVDILRGSENSTAPIYDLDSDGHPDVWLDTASIYPKGFTIEIDTVFWINPWEHLRESDTLYFEDIDHDGVHPLDTNRDGTVDIGNLSDRIRVWKLTWDVEDVPAYQVYEPYCSYTLWLDAPNLYSLSTGVAYAEGTLENDFDEMFFPYTEDLNSANLADPTWQYWMKSNELGETEYKHLVKRIVDSDTTLQYIDINSPEYTELPNDFVYGSAPVPYGEFVAVIMLGGEEIDMYNPKPESSLYSKIDYKTVFNEQRTSPLPTMYIHMDRGHYNHFSFTHLTQNPRYTDQNVDLTTLPLYGEADLELKIDVATEYSYYWVRNFGYDVHFNDPSLALDGVDGLGDGIFGYMVYDIPKGYGGYSIDLPRKADGTFDIDSIVRIDGMDFNRWIENENTGDSIEIWEDNFKYSIFIPQLLVPPAMDDDNHDGINDWIDDRGDRFYNIGNLHDNFMLGNGESYPNYPETPFTDPIYGTIYSGWYPGADETYGDDDYEQLGKVEITINAIYNGDGYEGPVELSKGGWLALESLNGGSPYTVFSHAINGYAKGTDLQINSHSTPSTVHFGIDTTFIKHHIYDANEPHTFDSKFDPYFTSAGYENAAAKVYVGGNDPCSLIEPDISMSAIIDPEYRHTTVTLIPHADPENPVLENFPMEVEGAFVEFRVDLTNSSDFYWKNLEINTLLPDNYGEVVMEYMAVPRPLLPNEDINTFSAAWNGENSEGDVLLTLGNELPKLESYHRAYYVALIKVNEQLENGVYYVDFDFSATEESYDLTHSEDISFEIPQASFSISERDDYGNITEYQDFIIGQTDLGNFLVDVRPEFTSFEDVRWANYNVNENHFADMVYLPSDVADSVETVDLSSFKNFPNDDTLSIYMLQKGEVNTTANPHRTYISEEQTLNYSYLGDDLEKYSSKDVYVAAIGPQIQIEQSIYKLNGKLYPIYKFSDDYDYLNVEVKIEVTSTGNDMAQSVIADFYSPEFFVLDTKSLPAEIQVEGEKIRIFLGDMVPGETETYYLKFNTANEISGESQSTANDKVNPTNIVIDYHKATYNGALDGYQYKIKSDEDLIVPVVELTANSYNTNSLRSMPQAGSILDYSVNISSFVSPVTNCYVTAYAVVNKDTVVVEEKLQIFNLNESKDVEFSYKIPKNAYYLELITVADSKQLVYEFNETDNIVKKKIKLGNVKPEVVEIYTYPNPFKANTTLNYFVKGEISEIDVTIYDIKGKPMSIFDASAEMGHNKLDIIGLNYQTGAYIYILKATLPDGTIQKYSGKMIVE